MTPAELTYGEAREVSDYLNTKEGVTQDELHSALINALNRITGLERTLAMSERAANRAANDASCLANGIQPD